jgi:hypothetical protein
MDFQIFPKDGIFVANDYRPGIFAQVYSVQLCTVTSIHPVHQGSRRDHTSHTTSRQHLPRASPNASIAQRLEVP